MKFQKIVFKNCSLADGLTALVGGTDAEAQSVLTLNLCMPVEVIMDFDTVLFFGKLLPCDSKELTIGCITGEKGFPHCEINSIVLIRAYDVKMYPVLLRAKVVHSSITKCVLGDLELIPYKTQRHGIRYPLNPPANIYLLSDTVLYEPQPCQLINLSTGGACIVSEYSYAILQRLWLRVEMFQNIKPCFYRCQVIRITPRKGSCFEYGLAFAELTPDERNHLTLDIQKIQMNTEKKFRSAE